MQINFLFSISLFILLDISYAEIRKLMPICSNSCLIQGDSKTRTCFCDSKCSLVYNDCCLDAPYRTYRMGIKRRQNLRCVFVHGENKHFWMVNSCKESWAGHEHIQEKCDKITDLNSDPSDLIESLPVTDPTEGVTYKNYYCAMCNNASTEQLVEWTVKALCSSTDVTQKDILQNLTYVEESQQWGVWKLDEDQDWVFRECYLLFEKPANVTNGVRSCTAGMVSACPRSWPDITTRRKCKSYIDPVKWSDGLVYRNKDCAVCHNRTMEHLQCVYDVTRGTNAIMLKRALLVDLSCSGQWF